MIINGKYKRHSLVSMVQDTSKQIVNLFYHSKKAEENNNETPHETYDSAFMTGVVINN